MKDEDFEVFLEDFTDMLTELEAAVAKMKQQIARLAGAAEAKTAATQTRQPQSQLAVQEQQLERVKQVFGELAGYLTFTAAEGKIVVRARQFLGSEVFSKVANITRALGGRYISAGKESHFEIPLQ